jgi:hypothetical protein
VDAALQQIAPDDRFTSPDRHRIALSTSNRFSWSERQVQISKTCSPMRKPFTVRLSSRLAASEILVTVNGRQTLVFSDHLLTLRPRRTKRPDFTSKMSAKSLRMKTRDQSAPWSLRSWSARDPDATPPSMRRAEYQAERVLRDRPSSVTRLRVVRKTRAAREVGVPPLSRSRGSRLA